MGARSGGHEECTKKLKILYNTLDIELEGRRPLGRPGHRRKLERMLLICVLKK
jgi:hypothetical protein